MTSEEHYANLTPEPVPTDEPGEPRHAGLMPRVLRAVGAAMLVIAASSFMFRDWGQHDDVTRYLMLLGQLGLLAAAGFYCGLKLEEKRGARTFLSLVVAVVPVHFAVLGGVLYSQFALDAPSSHLAAHAVWQASDGVTAIALALGAQLLIVPATFVSMMTLARRHARGLTLAFIGVCAVLLVPVRETATVTVLVACLTPLVLVLQLRVFSGTATLSTPQGRFARAMLSVPLLIIISRTLLYYPITAGFLGVTLFSLGLASFVHDVRADRQPGLIRFAVPQFLAMGAMMLGHAIVAGELILRGVEFGGFAAPLLVLPWAAIIFVGASFTRRGTLGYRRLAAVILTVGMCSNLLAYNELASGLLGLATGVALGLYGARIEQKAIVALGVLTALAGVVSVGLLTIRIEALTHWGSLTAVGIAMIFGAAALDRNRQRLLRRLTVLRVRMEGWNN